MLATAQKTLAPDTRLLTTQRALSRRHQWLLVLGVIVVGLLMQMLPLLVFDYQGRLVPRFVFWTIEMPTLLVALSLGYEWSQKRALGTTRSLLVTLGLAVTIGALSALAAHAVIVTQFGLDALPGPASKTISRGGMMVFGVMSGIFTAGLWVLAFIYPSALEDAKLRSIEAEKLRLEADALRTAAELTRLRSQLEPHFLLNTLNAIAGLVTQDPREARRLIALLGSLLGDSLRDDGEPTLERELVWLHGYASILESRFKGVLTFDWQIDESALDALVPHLFLQPLLENAVTHGALASQAKRPDGGPGHVSVTIHGRGEPGQRVLTCRVADDGPGFSTEGSRRSGIGISAARRRLELWSPHASLRFESSEAGTCAIVELPEGTRR